MKRDPNGNRGTKTSQLNHIDRLVKEEEGLHGRSELTNDDRERCAELKVELDRCSDLLRQRRALREFGNDPDKARLRPARIAVGSETVTDAVIVTLGSIGKRPGLQTQA